MARSPALPLSSTIAYPSTPSAVASARTSSAVASARTTSAVASAPVLLALACAPPLLALACAPAPVQVLTPAAQGADATTAPGPLDASPLAPDGGLTDGGEGAPADASVPDALGIEVVCVEPVVTFEGADSGPITRQGHPDIPARALARPGGAFIYVVPGSGGVQVIEDRGTGGLTAPIALGLPAVRAFDSLIRDPRDGAPLATFLTATGVARWEGGAVTQQAIAAPARSLVATREGVVLTAVATGSAPSGLELDVERFDGATRSPVWSSDHGGPSAPTFGLTLGDRTWLATLWDCCAAVLSVGEGPTLWGPTATRSIAFDATVIDGVPRFFLVGDSDTETNLYAVQPTTSGLGQLRVADGRAQIASAVAWSDELQQGLVAASVHDNLLELSRFDARVQPIGDRFVAFAPTNEGARLVWVSVAAAPPNAWTLLVGMDEGVRGQVSVYRGKVTFCPPD